MALATADALTSAPMNIAAAPRAARMARVPFVVLMKPVRPAQIWGVKAGGLLPRSKPGGGSAFSSPQSRAGPAKFLRAAGGGIDVAERCESRCIPADRAAVIEVVARRTSKTTTVRPSRCSGCKSRGRRTTSIRIDRLILGSPERRQNKHADESEWFRPSACCNTRIAEFQQSYPNPFNLNIARRCPGCCPAGQIAPTIRHGTWGRAAAA